MGAIKDKMNFCRRRKKFISYFLNLLNYREWSEISKAKILILS